jgi:hypothetical protein
MTLGFTARYDYRPIVGWELYQVTIDKYHVMFWFQNGHALLNVANKLSYRSADGAINYSYDIYGSQKSLNVDRILRVAVREVRIISLDRLDIEFENGDVLSIYDNPKFRSWWFTGGFEGDTQVNLDDPDEDNLTQAEELEWRKRLTRRSS